MSSIDLPRKTWQSSFSEPAVAKLRLVAKSVDILEFSFEVELIQQPARRRDRERFTASRMAATTVRPVAAPQPLRRCALLQQQLAGLVEKKERKSAMQDTATVVGIGFRRVADFVIVPIDQDKFFALRRDDSVLLIHDDSTCGDHERTVARRCRAFCTSSIQPGHSATIDPPPPAPVSLAPTAPLCRANTTMRSRCGVETPIAFNKP